MSVTVRRRGRRPTGRAWTGGSGQGDRGRVRARVGPGRGVAAVSAGDRPRNHGGGHRAAAGQRDEDGADLGPVPGRLGQAGLDQRTQPLVVQAGQVRRLADDTEHDRGGAVAAEWLPTGRRERQHGTEGEHVAGGQDRIAPDLLGGHVRDGAYHRPSRGQRGRADRPGDPEVDDPRAVLGHDHVAGLQVPVYHAMRVDRGQPLGQPGAQRAHLPGRQRSVPADRLL